MKKYMLSAIVAGAVLLGSGSGANALLIDFTAQQWAGIGQNTQTSYFQDYPGLRVTVSAVGGNLTYNGGTDTPGPIDVLAGVGDGLGIYSDTQNSDEVDDLHGNEILTITFSQKVFSNALYLLDFFIMKPTGPESDPVTEQGQFSFDGGSTWKSFSAEGVLDFGFNKIDISGYGPFTSISFKPLNDDDNIISDFALAGIDVSPVPEPATVLLFSAGLAGLVGFRGIRKKK